MPRVSFSALPDHARVWVFASNRPLTGAAAEAMLNTTDEFLEAWTAHGEPLVCAREWRDDRFLAVGVDQSTAGASGCSIDGLFRAFRDLESTLGASLLTGARVYYRDMDGAVCAVSRDEFAALAASGVIGRHTVVFDTTVTTAGDWRARFETAVGESWHLDLVPALAR
jgi:hypothetical protein